MIVDLHAHLLPSVDDGAKDVLNSIEIAQSGVADGVERVVVTPHHHNGLYVNHKADVIEATKALQAHYDEAGIKLTLSPGQEIRVTEHLLDDLYNDDLLSLDDNGRYLLLEFPTANVPLFSYGIIEQLIEEGITPIIAHPERNHGFGKDYNLLYDFIEMGCLSQITSSSYIGKYGNKIQTMASDMIRLNLSHVIASDVHNLDYRPYNLTEAYHLLGEEFGSDRAEHFKENARRIIDGQDVERLEAKQVKRKGSWFNFFRRN